MSDSPVIFDLKGKRVFVTGHAGMVGSAIVRRLEREDCDIVTAARRDLEAGREERGGELARAAEAMDRLFGP